MSKRSDTRERILKTGLEQSVVLGLEGVSLGPLAEEVGLSKSGLFAHFQSKEQLQLAIVEEAVARFSQAVVAPAFKKPAGLPRLRALFDNHLDWIAGRHIANGCPFVIYVQEFDDRPGPVRDRVAASQRDWRNLLMDCVRDAMAQGALAKSARPEAIAFALSGAALTFHLWSKLLHVRGARSLALDAFDRALA